jgi:hypothetical protein
LTTVTNKSTNNDTATQEDPQTRERGSESGGNKGIKAKQGVDQDHRREPPQLQVGDQGHRREPPQLCDSSTALQCCKAIDSLKTIDGSDQLKAIAPPRGNKKIQAIDTNLHWRHKTPQSKQQNRILTTGSLGTLKQQQPLKPS